MLMVRRFPLIICAFASVFTAAQAPVPTPAPDLQKRYNQLEAKLFDYLFITGGEAIFADEIADLRKQLEDLKKKLSAPHLEQTNHGWFSGFFQAQFVNTAAQGTQTGDFRNRRTRLNYNHIGDSRTMGRISFDFSAGVNQTTTQIRDAFIQYKPATYLAKSGPSYTIGQQNTPLGYEISYASWARTWPERAAYNQAYHNGERGRGAVYQNGDSSNYWYAGIWSGLTVNDVEAVNNTRGPAGEIGPIAGFHAKRGNFEYGLSGMSVRRPRATYNGLDLPVDARRFLYADLRYHPSKSNFDLRAEVMRGRDRIAGQNLAATDTSAYHVTIDYKLNATDTFILRHEEWDADLSGLGGSSQLYGLGYVRDVNQFLRLSMALQWTTQLASGTGTASQLNNFGAQAITLRAQFKF